MSKSGLLEQSSFFSLESNRAFIRKMVGLTGLEPVTPALSRRCSNQLSYRPIAGLLPAISNLKFQISNCAEGAGGG